ncbi:MAG: glycosyltransferase family 39 protein [Anaerolineales bacterium]|nr:glycosyltransferase family 39 protein [Anaerolineales bacterium]
MKEELTLEELAPWLLVPIVLIGAGLRVLLLEYKGMWVDETFSVWMANQPIGDMLQWIVKIDQHPPLYYLLLHYWIALKGTTPYAVRLFSVLFGAATIPVIYLIGKRISGVVMGLAAAVFLAFSPFHIYYAQETRMYTLLTFNAAVAIYALVRLLTDARAVKPIGRQFREYVVAWRAAGPVEADSKTEFSYKVERPRTGLRAWIHRHRWSPIQTVETDLAWIAFIVFSAATMLTHNTAVLFPLATNIFVLGLMLYQRNKESEAQLAFQSPAFGNWVKAQIGIFVLWSPWIAAFVRQVKAIDRHFWIPVPTWNVVIQTLKSFLNASAPLPTVQAWSVWGLYILLLGLGVAYFRKKFSQFLFLAALFAVPFLGELIVSIRRPIFYDRTLIWITIPLFLLLAAGAIQLRYNFVVLMVVGVFGTINLFSTTDYFRFYQKENWQAPAGYVANFAEKDDLVLFNSNFMVIPFDYYFGYYEELYDIEVEKQGLPLDLFADGVLEPEMTADDVPGLISLLREHDRVWLVYSHEFYTDPQGLIPETLASQMELSRERNFYGGQVQLYVTP